MQENSMTTMHDQKGDHISISDTSKVNLKETGQWSMFLSILGFVMIGLLVLAGFFAGSFISRIGGSETPMPFPGYVFGLIYVIGGAIYFPPIYFLYMFSANMKKAITASNQSALDIAFQNLKNHYRYIGILTVVFLAIYLMFGLGAAIFWLLIKH